MKTNEKLSVFIVDDDKMLSCAIDNIIKTAVKEQTLEINEFETGEDCLQNLEKYKPEIVVLDYFLDSKNPEAKNGIEILKKIKEFNKDIKVLMLSGQDKLQVAANCLKYGASDYLVKNEAAFMKVGKSVELMSYDITLNKDVRKFVRSSWIIGSLFVLSVLVGVAVLRTKGIYFSI